MMFRKAVKTLRASLIIFLLSCLVPAFAEGKKNERTNRIAYVNVLGAQLDVTGKGWEVAKLCVISKQKRIGLGFALVGGYKPRELPKLGYLGKETIPFPEKWPNAPETNEGLDTYEFFPMSFYFVPLTWGREKKTVRSVYFYIHDLYFWSRILNPHPTLEYEDKRYPAPAHRWNTEIGIGMNPWGAFLSLRAFCKKVWITPGLEKKRESAITGNVYYPGTGGNYFFYFPGYDETFVGVGVDLYLGGWFRNL